MHSEHILCNVIHRGWECKINEHVADLARILELDSGVLNFSSLSLRVVEDRILSRWSHESFDKIRTSLFSPLLAYAGEIVRRSVCGEWLIIEDEETGTLEPWIVDEYQRRFDIMQILHPFVDDPDVLGLKAMVEVIPKLPKK